MTEYYFYDQQEFVPLYPFCHHKGKWYHAEIWDGATGTYIAKPKWEEWGIGRPIDCTVDEECQWWINECQVLVPTTALTILVMYGLGKIEGDES